MARLVPLVPPREKKTFFLLLFLSSLMALNELAITGLVALLAAAFSAPAAVLRLSAVQWLLNHSPGPFWHDSRLLVLAILAAILGAVACKNALSLMQQWKLASFGEGMANVLRSRLLKLCLQAPYLWVLRKGTSDILFAMKESIMLNEILYATVYIFSNALMIVTIMSVLIITSPSTSVLFLSSLCFGGIFFVNIFKKKIDSRSRISFQVQHNTHSLEQKAIHGLKEMRLYGRESWLLDAYATNLKQMLQARKMQHLYKKAPFTALEMLGFFTLFLVLLFLIFVQDASMARISGIMGFLAAASWRCLPVVNRLVENMTSLRAHLPYLHCLLRILAEENDIAADMLPLGDSALRPLTFGHSLRCEDVCFRYESEGKDDLAGVSFALQPGQMLGLVGPSGAGKSTLANVLTGLLPPSRGRVVVDGTALCRDNVRSWLGKIGYVSQSPYLFDATLAENIALSRFGETIDRERVLTCCKMAAIDFVDELSLGIDSRVGERGVRLSGGQGQRIAIARALYSQPELIIFDEATSALDIKNEKAILDTIVSLRDKVTMVIIAHRLTTVASCDRIIWLENGSVRLMGSAEEVLPQYLLRLEQAGSGMHA